MSDSDYETEEGPWYYDREAARADNLGGLPYPRVHRKLKPGEKMPPPSKEEISDIRVGRACLAVIGVLFALTYFFPTASSTPLH